MLAVKVVRACDKIVKMKVREKEGWGQRDGKRGKKGGIRDASVRGRVMRMLLLNR